MSMRKITLAPGELLRSVHMEKSYLGKSGLPGVVQRVTRLWKLPLGNKKTHVNSCRRQTVHRGKIDPGVSELPGAMSYPGII